MRSCPRGVVCMCLVCVPACIHVCMCVLVCVSVHVMQCLVLRIWNRMCLRICGGIFYVFARESRGECRDHVARTLPRSLSEICECVFRLIRGPRHVYTHAYVCTCIHTLSYCRPKDAIASFLIFQSNGQIETVP